MATRKTKIPPRKIIRDNVKVIEPYEFEITLDELLVKMQDLIAKHGGEARLNYDPYFYYPYDQNPSPRFYVNVYRPENDIEFEARVDKEEKQRTANEECELKELARLQAKFKVK